LPKALFLDRDGVINIDKEYLHKIEDFEFCNGVFEVLKHFQNLGYLLVVVTNQSGIGRGYYSEEDFLKLTSWMVQEFQNQGITISKVYHCPHTPQDNCTCRKPNTGMFELAFEEFGLDMKNSWMIGDKPSDIQAAKKAGVVNTVFIGKEACKEAKYSVKSLLDIIKLT
jgi:D-glycero-D-manno-heptose 1,7-bisphosphate phosphatase